MVSGLFIENIPLIRIAIAWGRGVQTPHVILDTGFTGDLQVTPKIALELGLEVAGVTAVRFASGEVRQIPTALAFVAMEGAVEYLQVLISDGSPLVGIGFLTKFDYRATIDCKYRRVSLERVH